MTCNHGNPGHCGDCRSIYVPSSAFFGSFVHSTEPHYSLHFLRVSDWVPQKLHFLLSLLVLLASRFSCDLVTEADGIRGTWGALASGSIAPLGVQICLCSSQCRFWHAWPQYWALPQQPHFLSSSERAPKILHFTSLPNSLTACILSWGFVTAVLPYGSFTLIANPIASAKASGLHRGGKPQHVWRSD